MAKRRGSEGAAVAGNKQRNRPAIDSLHGDDEDKFYEEKRPPVKKSKDSCGDSLTKQSCIAKRPTVNDGKTVGKQTPNPPNLKIKTPVKKFSGSKDAEESEDEWEDVEANNQPRTGKTKRTGSENSKAGVKKERRLSVKSNIRKRSRPGDLDDGEDGFKEESSVKKRKPTVPGVKGKTKAAKPAGNVSCAGNQKPRAKKSAVKDPKTEETEILDLLALEKKTPRKGVTELKESSESEEAEDSDDEWEDVEELNGPVLDDLQASTSADIPLPTQPVEIEIETAEAAKKRLRREKRKEEFAAYLRRLMKKVREDTHKVHLLCLLANGFYRSNTCNLPDLQAVALSVVPVKFTSVPAERVDVVYLTNLTKWFRGTFTLSHDMSLDESESMSATLERRFGVYGVRDEAEMVHVFLILLRALQLLSRLVLSLQPITLKDPPTKTKQPRKEKSSKRSSTKTQTAKGKSKSNNRKQVRQKKVKQEDSLSGESEEEEEYPVDCTTSGRGKGKTTKGKKAVKSADKEEACTGARPKNQLRRKAASKVTYKEESESCGHSSDSDFCLSASQDSDCSEWEEEPLDSKRRRSTGPVKEIIKKERNTNPIAKEQPRAKNPTNSLSSTQPKRRGKIISTDESEMDDEGTMEKASVSPIVSDQWVEVYLESERKWLCVDCVHWTVGKPQMCFNTATKPVTYVVGIDNAGCVKDVTRRYDVDWMTSTRKRRVEPDWWEETLMPYKSPDADREDREEVELEFKLLDQPLPTSITEYKNHPLYVLKRHLLKYEAIYPETAAILGYCRGEAVYSRSCVHTLHSSDTWLKEARVVRLAEVPYKMVKGYSNRARKARSSDPDKKDHNDLGLYGLWQTEEYQPPLAVDGKVPRNEYGNVYLFQPCMLPIGCAHLRVPNLHRVARKLDIDCVKAITGFDFHGGYSHPVNDGYVVCEEHKDILLAAWENEQADIEQKQKEKREKRALGNWKLLVKGLLIRERLKARYGNKDTELPGLSTGTNDFSSDEEEKPKTETPAQDMAASWPQNRQAEHTQAEKTQKKSKKQKKGEENHLFPFEKL